MDNESVELSVYLLGDIKFTNRNINDNKLLLEPLNFVPLELIEWESEKAKKLIDILSSSKFKLILSKE